MGIRPSLRTFVEGRGKMGSNVQGYCTVPISNQIPSKDECHTPPNTTSSKCNPGYCVVM